MIWSSFGSNGLMVSGFGTSLGLHFNRLVILTCVSPLVCCLFSGFVLVFVVCLGLVFGVSWFGF